MPLSVVVQLLVLASGSLASTEHAPHSSVLPKSSKAKSAPIQMHMQPNGALTMERHLQQPIMRTHTHVKTDELAGVSILANEEKAPHGGQDVQMITSVTRNVTTTETMDNSHNTSKLAVLVIFAIVLVYWAPRLSSYYLASVVCAVYVTLSVAIDLLIASLRQQENGKKHGPYAFDPVCCVILVEACKLVFSLSLLAWNHFSGAVDLSGFDMQDFLKNNALWMALPGVFFTANNVLIFLAIGKNDVAAFGVFRETLILWTCMFWRFFFRVDLGYKRMLGVGIIFVGMVGNRVSATEWSWAILWILAMTFSNASATVVNEFALKRSMGLDINIPNAVLYVVCMSCSILVLAVQNPWKLFSFSAFFEGFDRSTFLTVLLQILAGLTVSRILKYADSVTKCVASCLRGPILVVLAPYLVHSSSELSTILSSLVVSAGCLMYLLQGPIQTGVQKAPVTIKIPPPETLRESNADCANVEPPKTNSQ